MGTTSPGRILIIDDNPPILHLLRNLLTNQGYEAVAHSDPAVAMQVAARESFDAVLTDLVMAPVCGLQIIVGLTRAHPNVPVIAMTAGHAMSTAMEALKQGAFDYLTKPIQIDQLLSVLSRAVEFRRVRAISTGETPLPPPPHLLLGSLVAESAKAKDLAERIRRIALSDTPVLISGEVGTGKRAIARLLHNLSRRRLHPVYLAPAASERSSFLDYYLTGLVPNPNLNTDIFERMLLDSAGGTLIVDEIQLLPHDMQKALASLIQDHTFRDSDTERVTTLDVRIVATVSQNLARGITPPLNPDLGGRLGAVTLEIPPLRERNDDILPLFFHYIRQLSPTGRHPPTLVPATQKLLETYTWPGNVRELMDTVKHVLDNGLDRIEPGHLPPLILASVGEPKQKTAAEKRIEAYRAQAFKTYLEQCRQRIARTDTSA